MNASDSDTPVTSQEPADTAAPADSAPAAKRRRAPRKLPAPQSAQGDDAQPSSAAPASTVERAGEPTAASAAQVAPQAAAQAAADSVPSMAGEPAPVAAHQAAASDDVLPASGPAGADQPDAVEGARSGSRRNRNRRRGRRGNAMASDDLPTPGEGDATALPDVRVHLPQPEVGEVLANVLSGAYDADAAPVEVETGTGTETAPALPSKRVLAPEADAPKLHKVLAQAGIGSRRDMEQLVAEGRITVNGQPAHVGQRISFGDQLRIDGRTIKARITPPPPRVLAYHQPAGEVVTHDDPQHRPTVFRRLPRLAQGKWQSVGRLDINTEGLLLFTNSGELANQLMHPRFGVEREYAVRVLGALDDNARERLLQGVTIDGQPCAFKSLDDAGGEGANRWYRVVITEGRNREVRKLIEAVGHAVSRLIRVRYGSVVLPRGLRRGLCVDLAEADVWTLRRMARPAPRPPAGAQQPGGAAGNSGAERRDRRGPKGRNERRRGASGQPGVERREPAEDGPIPNPLQQTFDKRAFQQSRARREINEDGPIPNPLQQTFDKRALQQDRARRPEVNDDDDGPIPNPLQQTYDKRFVQQPGGLGGGRGARKKPGHAAPRQPDPMQTAVGYIGADAFKRKNAAGRGRAGGGRGKPGRGSGRGR